MQRCCATVNDPASGAVVVFVEVNSADDPGSINDATAAAAAAAQTAYKKAKKGDGPAPTTFTVPGSATSITVDLTTISS